MRVAIRLGAEERDVELEQFLTTRRQGILGRWTERALSVYAPDAARAMSREKDRFRNPVGHITKTSLQEIYDGLAAGLPTAEMAAALDEIVRIRAVQDLSPSRAVGFLLLLKESVREELGDNAAAVDLSELDSRIDRLMLEAFDLFMGCREKVHELRRNEIRLQTSAAFERRRRGATGDAGAPR
jgi:hypothetical protein